MLLKIGGSVLHLLGLMQAPCCSTAPLWPTWPPGKPAMHRAERRGVGPVSPNTYS